MLSSGRREICPPSPACGRPYLPSLSRLRETGSALPLPLAGEVRGEGPTSGRAAMTACGLLRGLARLLARVGVGGQAFAEACHQVGDLALGRAGADRAQAGLRALALDLRRDDRGQVRRVL